MEEQEQEQEPAAEIKDFTPLFEARKKAMNRADRREYRKVLKRRGGRDQNFLIDHTSVDAKPKSKDDGRG